MHLVWIKLGFKYFSNYPTDVSASKVDMSKIIKPEQKIRPHLYLSPFTAPKGLINFFCDLRPSEGLNIFYLRFKSVKRSK